MEDNQTSRMLKLTQALFFVEAVVWLVFGALTFGWAMSSTGNLNLFLSVLMVANAVVMAWFGVMIVRAKNYIFFLGIIYMAINVILSITDQLGLLDILILLLNLVLLGLLFVTRQRIKMTGKVLSGDM